MSSSSTASSSTTDYKMSRVIRYIYDGANFHKEITAKRERKKALEAIQKSLPSPPSILSTTDSHDKIASAINQIDDEEKALRHKLHSCEASLKQQFQICVEEISQKMMRDGDAKVEDALRKKLEQVETDFKAINIKMAKEMDDIRQSKLGVEEGTKRIAEMVRASREQLIQRTEEQIDNLRSQNKQAFVELRDRYVELSSVSYKEQLRATVARDVIEKVNEQLKSEDLEPFKQQVIKLMEQNKKTPDSSIEEKCVELVQKEIRKHIDKEEVLKQLNGLPEWTKMISKVEEIDEKIGRGKHAPEINAIQYLRNDLSQMNRKIDAIQKQLEKSVDKDSETQQLAAVSRSVQDIARDLAVTNSQLEMAQTWYTFNDAELARQKNHRPLDSSQDDGDRSKKRQRTEDDDADEKLKLLEQKQASLTEYVNGFRSTVLNPQFPERLQKAMTDIELVLRSHEEFIAHLVDPVRAAQRVPVDLTGDSRQIPQNLSPAMIQAIQTLVKNTAEQTAKPLLDRIAALEAKLNQKQ